MVDGVPVPAGVVGDVAEHELAVGREFVGAVVVQPLGLQAVGASGLELAEAGQARADLGVRVGPPDRQLRAEDIEGPDGMVQGQPAVAAPYPPQRELEVRQPLFGAVVRVLRLGQCPVEMVDRLAVPTDRAVGDADGANWSSPAILIGVGSSSAPALASWGGRLYSVWKGRDTDQRLFYASSPDGN